MAGSINALAQDSLQAREPARPHTDVHFVDPSSAVAHDQSLIDPLYDLKEAFFDASLPDGQLEALAVLQAVIYQGDLPPAVVTDGLLFLGHRYYALGEWDAALDTFVQMAAAPDSGAVGMDAARMVGQIELLVNGDQQAAGLAYRDVLARSWAARNTSSMSMQVEALEQEAATQLAGLMLKSGRYSEAMAFAGQALVNARKTGDHAAVESLSLTIGRAAIQLGMNDEARVWFSAVSETRRAEGDTSWIQVERELAHGLPTIDEAIERLAAVWQVDGLLDEPSYYVVSHELAGLLFEVGEDLAAVDVLDSLAGALGTRFAEVGDGIARSTVGLIHEDALLTLAIESGERGDLRAQQSYLRQFARFFPASPRLDHVRKHIPSTKGVLDNR